MRFLFIAAALLFSSASFSADYYFIRADLYPSSPHYSSPMDACNSRFAELNVASPGYYRSPRVIMNDPNSYTCQAQFQGWSWSYTSLVSISRDGDSCSPGSVYNSSTHLCEPPQPDPCESQTGFINHQNKTYSLDGSAPRADPPPIICQSACQYTFTQEAPNNCYRFADGTSPNGGFCSYKYKGSGTSCTDGPTKPPGSVFDQPPTKPPIDVTPTLSENFGCSPSVTNPATGTKSRTCNGVTEFTKPGSLDCAAAGTPASSSAAPCTSGTPKPEYKKDTVSINDLDISNPDGSTDSTSTKTTTSVVCTGVNACTTKTKEETTSNGKNSDGSDKPATGDCKGETCKPAKDPNSPEGEEEGEEEEPRVATGGGSCEASPSCSGDAIDCAVLAEVNKVRCDAEEAGDYPKHKGDIEGLLSGDKFKLGEDELINAPSFIDSGARFLPSACPADANINLNFVGGHSYALSYSPFCFLAESLAPLILIAASLFAALYVGRSFGGE